MGIPLVKVRLAWNIMRIKWRGLNNTEYDHAYLMDTLLSRGEVIDLLEEQAIPIPSLSADA
jgi:hypothetical protein